MYRRRLFVVNLSLILAVLTPCVDPASTFLHAQSASRDIFVSSRNTDSIKRFDGDTGEYLGDFVEPNSGGLVLPQEILFDADGHLLVTGRMNANILKYDGETGEFIGAFSSGYALDNPTKMTLGPDNLLYVSQWGQSQNKVVRFDAETGTFVDEFTTIGLSQGCGHAWDEDGNLYVAAFGSADVRTFRPDGRASGDFVEDGILQGPVNLWFGDNGDLFVIDWPQGSVFQFDGQSGSFKSTFISGMQTSEGFTFSEEGLLYICDWSRNQVVRFDQSGELVDLFATGGGMAAPNSVVFGPPNVTSVDQPIDVVPEQITLHHNYPNPFNPTTTIAFQVSQVAHVAVTIYNDRGQKIRTLLNEQRTAGTHFIAWDGTDEAGQLVSSGIYIYRLETETFTRARKMLLLK